MIVLEAIITCRWPLVALTYALPETIWLRVESAYIFDHKYPIAESSMIRWMGTMKLIQVWKPPSLIMMLWSLLSGGLLYIIVKLSTFVADQMLWLVRPHALPQDCIWIRVHTVRHGLITCLYYYPGYTIDLLWEKFQWILPLCMKPINFQSKASVVCSVTAAIFIDFCLKKLNVFSQHIGQKQMNIWIPQNKSPGIEMLINFLC